ncbi:hypothetical protein HD554DRAFT_2325056 [Boletus coccyginus]|nr:hypothetical protein HD554DRAFT_2325056 [Boletus coccyginus]
MAPLRRDDAIYAPTALPDSEANRSGALFLAPPSSQDRRQPPFQPVLREHWPDPDGAIDGERAGCAAAELSGTDPPGGAGSSARDPPETTVASGEAVPPHLDDHTRPSSVSFCLERGRNRPRRRPTYRTPSESWRAQNTWRIRSPPLDQYRCGGAHRLDCPMWRYNSKTPTCVRLNVNLGPGQPNRTLAGWEASVRLDQRPIPRWVRLSIHSSSWRSNDKSPTSSLCEYVNVKTNVKASERRAVRPGQ